MMKNLGNKKGFTLIELIITLAILGLVASVVYPIVASSQLMVYRQINNSHDRNDLRLAISYLNNDIKYSKDVKVSLDSRKLTVTTISGETITYKIEGERLLRQKEENLEFLGIIGGSFNIQSSTPNLVNITLSTLDNETSFSVARSDYSIAVNKGDDKNFIIDDSVFIYGYKFKFQGNSIIARNGTIFIGSDLVTSDLNQGNFTNVKNIYIDGNLNLDGGSSGLGLDDNSGFMFINGNMTVWSGTRHIYGDVYVAGNLKLKDAIIHGNVYVQGDLELGWTPTINGKIFYKGNLIRPNNYHQHILARCIKVDTLPQYEFPQFSLPSLRADSWYYEKGYLQGGNIFNGARIFSQGNYSFRSSNTFKNVIIVSKGDINLSGWMHLEGVLFAPNGKITFSGGSFKGLAIAKDGVFVTSGGSTIEYKSIEHFILSSVDFPFIFE